MDAEKPDQVTGQDHDALYERAKLLASVLAKDCPDHEARYSPFLRAAELDRTEESAPFFSRAPLFLLARCLLEIIKIRGLATPEEMPAICSDRDRLRRILGKVPEVWKSSDLPPEIEGSMLDRLMAVLAEIQDQAQGPVPGANPQEN